MSTVTAGTGEAATKDLDLLKRDKEVSIDWCAGTFLEGQDTSVLAVEVTLMSYHDDWTKLPAGWKGYRSVIQGPGGARVMYDHPDRADVHFELPGRACQAAGSENLLALMRILLARGGHLTRLDLAVDDYRKRKSVTEVHKLVTSPVFVSLAETWRLMASGEVGTAELNGLTLYVGAPSSRQQLRVYDKELESKGVIDAVRWELQARDEAAQTAAMQMNEAGEKWTQVVLGRLGSFVDFREVNEADPEDDNRNTQRRKRQEWWREFLDHAEKLPAYPPQERMTVEKAKAWFIRQVAPAAAMLQAVHQDVQVSFGTWVSHGSMRWKSKHLAAISEWQHAFGSPVLAGGLAPGA